MVSPFSLKGCLNRLRLVVYSQFNLMGIETVEILQFVAIGLIFIEGAVFGAVPKLM